MKFNLQGIADEFNVSVSTVSRVLNNKKGVNKETREKILDYVNVHTTGLSNDLLQSVGLVDTYSRHKIDSYYLSFLLEGVDERLHAFRYNTMLIHSDQIAQQWHTLGECPVLKAQKGIIWMEPLFDEEYLALLKRYNLPCVVINNYKPDIPVDSIKSDNYSASRRGVEFLANHGHTNIGFIGGYLDLTNHKDRFAGFEDGLKAAGLELVEQWSIDDIVSWDDNGGAEGMHRILSLKKRPSVVMLASDLLAVGCYKAAREHGVRIPDDISIISFDDAPFAEHLTPRLTTFQQPLLKMGVAAAERLIALLMGKQADEVRHTLIDCPLIVRDSIATVGRRD
ncbi:MAG: LacI family transcriptional regulator [bacterium]|nr:LacI family transcriptional regulator [bacterium]